MDVQRVSTIAWPTGQEIELGRGMFAASQWSKGRDEIGVKTNGRFDIPF